jgi:hypothetical protein
VAGLSDWPNVVSVGDFVADVDSPNGFRIVTKLTGWEDSAPVRPSGEPKSQQDGDWDATPFLGSRIVGIEGAVAQDSPAAALEVADELTGLQVGQVHIFTVDNEAIGPRSAAVRIEVGAVLEWLDDMAFTYTMQVKAPDPLKYGPETFASTSLAGAAGGTGLLYPLAYPLDYGVPPGVTPGAITLGNAGTAAYWPRLRIDGPVPNPSVSMVETGDSLRYNGTLAAGQWLDIDTANRRVLLNGQVSMRHLVSVTGRWLGVPVGGGSLTWTADAADPAATLSAWGYEGAWL